METGPANNETGASNKPKKDTHRGKTVKAYLRPDDFYRVEEDMRKRGFDDRGPYILHLISRVSGVEEYQTEQANRLVREIMQLGVRELVLRKLQEVNP